MANDISAIIFDLGNVIVDFDHRIAARKILQFTDRSEEELFNLFFDSGLTGLFEEGKISSAEFFSQVKNLLGLRLDYHRFVSIWNEIFFMTDRNHRVYNIAKSLKQKFRIALLSNVNILHFEYIKKTFPVCDAFDHIVTSYEAGFRKPHPRIYQKTLDILGVAPEKCFYTDDRPQLIESARGLGISSYVFEGVEQLKDDLLHNGIAVL